MQKHDYLLPILGIDKKQVEYLQQICSENGVKCEIFWQSLSEQSCIIPYNLQSDLSNSNLYRLDCHLISHTENDLMFIQYLYDKHINDKETLERCFEQEEDNIS